MVHFLSKCISYIRRQFDFHSQFKPHVPFGPIPNKILKVPSAFLYCLHKAILNHIAQKANHIQKRTLSTGIRADQDVESVQPDVHIAQAAVVQGLYSADHGISLQHCLLARRGDGALGGQVVLDVL